MAAQIKQRFGTDVELIPSGGGVFEVVVDGELCFSKKQLNRFPEDEEIFDILEEKK